MEKEKEPLRERPLTVVDAWKIATTQLSIIFVLLSAFCPKTSIKRFIAICVLWLLIVLFLAYKTFNKNNCQK